VLDACIHFVAILRYLLAATGQNVADVSSHAKLLDPALQPVDSVFAVVQTNEGVGGTFSFSVGIPVMDGIDYDIVTDKGVVSVRGPVAVATNIKDEAGNMIGEQHEDEMTFGVPDEFAAFGAALSGSQLDPRISVEEALADLQLLEAMLKSNGQRVEVSQS
jgi:predicted dehydrogenase